MTTYAEPITTKATTSVAPRKASRGRIFAKWASSTDHKTIGYMYLITSFSWFLIGGALALALRAELAKPELKGIQSELAKVSFDSGIDIAVTLG